MKNLINVVVLLVLISGAAKSQDVPLAMPKESSNSDKKEVYQYVEEMPVFPGGDDAMMNYLSKNIKYPEKAREANIQGKVFVSFVVMADGTISNAKVVRGVNVDCDAEALRVVKAMPNWKPGKQSGKNVAVQFNLPINFKLKDVDDPVMKARKKN